MDAHKDSGFSAVGNGSRRAGAVFPKTRVQVTPFVCNYGSFICCLVLWGSFCIPLLERIPLREAAAEALRFHTVYA